MQPSPRGDYSCGVQVQSRRLRGGSGFEVLIEGVVCLYPSQDENNQSQLPRSNGSPHTASKRRGFPWHLTDPCGIFSITTPAIPANPAGAQLCSSYNLSFRRQTPLPLPPCCQTVFSRPMSWLVRSWVASDRKTYMLCSPEE